MTPEIQREFDKIIMEMRRVYLHDCRPWIIGFSGGKDSTLLLQLVFETIGNIPSKQRHKSVHVVTSDTMVENPIIKAYMHNTSSLINSASGSENLRIKAHLIYPEVTQTFWSLVIGLGYPTPEAPGFRWCTDRLKINPTSALTYEIIDKGGEVVILLGVRKAESALRSKSISSRAIEGKLLSPHISIPKAYVYNPLAHVPNEYIWDYLLRNDGISAWGSDNNYLFGLYQGEKMGEEQSVVGEIDKDKIPITGNSRFGCWCCTMVKEDKSLRNFIEHGATELIPLRDFRNWLVTLRSDITARDYRRRNGNVYFTASGELGRGPFTLETRKEILRRLLVLEKSTGFELITLGELKAIDHMWEDEGDLTRRALVEIYHEETGNKLPWDQYKHAKYDNETLAIIRELCEEYNVPFDLVSRLMISVDKTKHLVRSSLTRKQVERIFNQGWLHCESISKGIISENPIHRNS